ncbi:MAG: outer membrane beta-barrel protein [Ignavibacteriae bacterium]|nr:outer membrane beta-barrel protein [Ignavibacteriota bacterium]
MKPLAKCLLFVAFVLSAQAQPREGKTRELSISGSYQNYSSGSGSSSSSAFLICPRFGIFVVQGLEVEPEFIAMLATGGSAYVLNGNLSYNVIGAEKVVPFVLLGYGIANTLPLFNVPMTKYEFTVGVLNVGAGLKVFLRDDVALRLEYRFQNFKGEQKQHISGLIYSYARKVDTQLHTVQFGLSLLL